MSTPFTTPENTPWQTLLDELTLAWSERRQAIGQSAYVPEANRNVQSAAYWTAIQEWIENNCTSFVDHVNGPINEAGDAFLYFTLETFRAAAGIPNGFRRATDWDGTDDPAWSYGAMQSGDIIGPWIFVDLQNALSALCWTFGSAALDGMFYKRVWYNGGDWPDRDLASMKARAEATFVAMEPSAGLSWAHTGVFHYSDDPPWYDVDIRRTFGSANFSAALPNLAWELYALSVSPPHWCPELASSCDYTWTPFDDFSTTPTQDIYTKVASGTTTDGEISTPVGKDEVPPWADDLGVGCSAQKGHEIASLAFVLKWSFTHKNEAP